MADTTRLPTAKLGHASYPGGMAQVLPILLLLALPAAGKSEIRRYLDSLSTDLVADEFGLGRLVQLDDYPYVHLMRRISAELRHLYEPPVFFASAATPFLEAGDWGALIHLVNEDYSNLAREEDPEPPAAVEWLLQRLDRARRAVGLAPVLAEVSDFGRESIVRAVEEDAHRLWLDRHEVMTQGLQGSTVVIEFSRGGPEGATLPLPDPHGYRYSLGQLSPEILAAASILYVWVTPEESRRRNIERAHPGIEGDASILHHEVPEPVMRHDYGIDDLMWLIEQSDRPGTIRVEAHGSVYHLPAAVFDNRTDHTSFLRDDPETWPEESVALLHHELKYAFESLAVT